MKNLLNISFLLFVIISCQQPKPHLNNLEISKKSRAELESIAPKTAIGDIRLPQAFDQQPSLDVDQQSDPINANNRIILQSSDNKLDKDRLQAATAIQSVEENKILFTNGWSLSYWIPQFHNVLATPEEEVNIQYREDFILGAILNSVNIFSKDDLPILGIISTGSDQPVTYEFSKDFIVSQLEKEVDFVDNESETIKEVITVLNGEIPLSKEEAAEITIGRSSYQVSVNKSFHYYPKGNDSVEGPAYYLEFTITKSK